MFQSVSVAEMTPLSKAQPVAECQVRAHPHDNGTAMSVCHCYWVFCTYPPGHQIRPGNRSFQPQQEEPLIAALPLPRRRARAPDARRRRDGGQGRADEIAQPSACADRARRARMKHINTGGPCIKIHGSSKTVHARFIM